MNTHPMTPQLLDLTATIAELYPGSNLQLARVGRDPSALRLVPSRRHPRLAVPAGMDVAAAQALSRPSASDTLRTSAPRRLLSTLLSLGLGPLMMPHGLAGLDPTESIAAYLAEVMGHPVVVSLTVGSARANRKPILNVHSEAGREIGFAKVGLNDLTNGLVQHEAQTLDRLAARTNPAFLVPRMLHSGRWQGHEVLLMSALRPDVPQRRVRPLLAAAGGIIASEAVTHCAVQDSAWAAGLRGSMESLEGTDNGDLPALWEEYVARFGDVVIPFGAWHGDFGPWNLAHTSTVPMIWDWERYACHVPAGMDVVHYQTHRSLRRQGDLAVARISLEQSATAALSQVLAQLPDVRQPTPEVLKAIVAGYLLTIATRFTLDGRTPAGEPIRALARWHRHVIKDQLQRNPQAPAAMKSGQK